MTNSQSIRTFICLEIPEAIRELIDERATKVLRKSGARCSFVRPENLHITLKFLGDVETSRIDNLSQEIVKAVGNTPSFSLSLEGVGSFGGKKPKVVWAAIGGETERLAELAVTIDKTMAGKGFSRERRRFKPHLTIARVRQSEGFDRLISAIESCDLPREEFTANTVIFMKSTLTPAGSIYEPIAEFGL